MKLKPKNVHDQQTSISHLPPEVLSVIFCHLRDTFVDFIAVNQILSPSSVADDHEPWHWTTVTQVCHTWRVTALTTPTLWSHIILSPDTGGRWPEEMCRLSKQTPLNIILYKVNPLDHEIMNHLGRCRTLSMHRGEVPFNEVLPNINTSHLEYLLISDQHSLVEELAPFIFCDDALHAESLRRLRLHGCYIDWTSNLLRRLTHLTLINVKRECRLSNTDFIAFLTEIPALEVLRLSRFLKREETEDFPLMPSETVARLQNLKYLHLLSYVNEMARFLSRLRLPTLCKLSLTTWDKEKNITAALKSVLAWLAFHYGCQLPSSFTISGSTLLSPQHAIRSLCLHHSSPFFKVKGFFENLSYNHMGFQEPIFELITTWGLKDKRSLEEYLPPDKRISIDDIILRPYLTFLPLQHLAYLEVSGDSGLYMSEEAWVKIFGSIKTIEKIFLNTDALPFLTALTPGTHPWRSRPFSALSSIAYNDSIDFGSILACLRVRSRGGLKLKEFLFPKGCSIPATTMKQLEEMVSYIGFHSR